MRPNKRRTEVTTSGIDEALQGLSSDPLGSGLPQRTGLRIPPVIPGLTQETQPRYTFCLATRRVASNKIRLRGIRQYLSLGVDAQFGTPPERVIELPITTPFWTPPDGNVSWHLVTESGPDRVTSIPSTNAAGWAFRQIDGSAMLYESATFAAGTFNPQTGQPNYYFQGLTAYKPPKIHGDWYALGGLGNMHDLRFGPWSGVWFNSIDLVIEGATRVTLYASVLQTNPATRTNLTPPTTWHSQGATPEEAFLVDWTESGEGPTQGPTYWRVAGSLIFEDDIQDAVRVDAASNEVAAT